MAIHRRIARRDIVLLIALATTWLVGCAADYPGLQVTIAPSQRLAPTSPPATASPTAVRVTPVAKALPPALVGSWMQENWGGSSRTGYFTRTAYVFDAGGTYALYSLLCLTGGSCQDADPPESGIAVVTGNLLDLSPQTPSLQGPRSYVFAVVRDPNMGDLRLQFQMPGYVDEFFWQP